MSKKQNPKRKAQLNEKARTESFRFQVTWEKNQKMQVVLYYDNEIRNQVIDWVKARYEKVTTRLGQPILKRPNMLVEFKRVVKS